MAEFDNFESAEQPQTEEDPAAEFLAREQDQLAGLDDDNFGEPVQADSANTGISGAISDEFDPFSQPPMQEEPQEMMGGFDDGLENGFKSAEDVVPSDNTEEQKQEEPSVLLNTEEPIAPMSESDNHIYDSFHDAAADITDEPQDGYSAIAQADVQRQEPEKIRLWREEQQARLEEKDAESDERKEEWREIAKKELEDWYKHRDEQFEKTKVTNRESESAFIEERDDNIPGHEWERICRLCEFNPKQNRNQKDISRMRSILLQLKQAPAAAH